MSKKQRSKPAVAVLADPIASYVREVKQERSDALIASIGVAGEIIENAQSLVENGTGFTFQKQQPKQNWIDPRVDPQSIQPQEPAQTYQEFAETVIGKMAESLGVPSPLLDYESPSFSSARVDMQATLDPIPREDEARPCTLCESRRPAGKSYSRVYCTKRQVRYCKCHYCGHTWSQERK